MTFEGRAYYVFTDVNKMKLRDRYNPAATLIITFDFNAAPRVAVVAQEVALTNDRHGGHR